MFLDWTEKDVTYWVYIRLLQRNTADRERLILGNWIMGSLVLAVLISLGQVSLLEIQVAVQSLKSAKQASNFESHAGFLRLYS